MSTALDLRARRPLLPVAARIQALEQELHDLRERQLEALVTAIAAATADHVFTAAEVFEHARLVSPELRQVLDEADVTSPRRLGKLLQRWAHRPVAGWRLERVCRDGPGIVWVVSAEDLQDHAGLSRHPAV